MKEQEKVKKVAKKSKPLQASALYRKLIGFMHPKNTFKLELVEHYNTFSRQKKDLFGMFDYILHVNTIPGFSYVQVTSKGNLLARAHKVFDAPKDIEEDPEGDLRTQIILNILQMCHSNIELVGVEKVGRGIWEISIINVFVTSGGSMTGLLNVFEMTNKGFVRTFKGDRHKIDLFNVKEWWPMLKIKEH